MLKFLVVFGVIFVLVDTNTESSEDNHAYTYNSFYAPSTLNFNDIYTNNIAGPTSDDEQSTTTEELKESVIKPQFVEFHPDTMTHPPSTIPPPRYILNATYVQHTTVKTTTSTEEPDEYRVMPIKRRNYERGVLDLLFPSSRVKSFKSIFDNIRRVLSHTFRRR